MRVSELAPVLTSALPLSAFRTHLRLGTGFEDDTLQDALLEPVLRAALAVIERQTGRLLLSRQFTLRLDDWADRRRQPLDLVPVTGIVSVQTISATGDAVTLDPGRYRLVTEDWQAELRAVGPAWPAVPAGGSLVITVVAGLAPVWASLPPDLAQAVFLLAARYYEFRAEGDGPEAPSVPFGVERLIAPWRRLRLSARSLP